MWISKKRLEEIKKASYDAGLGIGYELASQPSSYRAAVEEAERILRDGR